ALVAIDVNSGKSTRERNIEQTALHTNLEAAAEDGHYPHTTGDGRRSVFLDTGASAGRFAERQTAVRGAAG
ncbi:MAG: ribonuclease E/G, partial [Pseudomonadota bacterium]